MIFGGIIDDTDDEVLETNGEARVSDNASSLTDSQADQSKKLDMSWVFFSALALAYTILDISIQRKDFKTWTPNSSIKQVLGKLRNDVDQLRYKLEDSDPTLDNCTEKYIRILEANQK